jgi:hypothetical protein
MESVKCSQCGLLNAASAESCTACGAELGGAFPYDRPYAGRENWSQTSEAKTESSTRIEPFTSVGVVISPTLELFKNNLWLITKIVVVVFAPYEILRAWESNSGREGWQSVIGLLLLDITCRALVAPALIFALMTVMKTGQAPTVSEAYRWTLGRLGRFMICVLLAWVLTLLGFMALIVPGIILSLAFEVVYPMAALEDGSPRKILERSYNLTQGYRTRIFLATLVIGLLCSVITMPAGVLMEMLVMSGADVWPLTIPVALIADVAYQLTTVLSLVIYLSLSAYAPQQANGEARTAAGAV